MCLGIKYDAEKEARQFLEARQRELQRIEEAKQKIADQGKSGKTNESDAASFFNSGRCRHCQSVLDYCFCLVT